jgi:hypothetical protein
MSHLEFEIPTYKLFSYKFLPIYKICALQEIDPVSTAKIIFNNFTPNRHKITLFLMVRSATKNNSVVES